jgi:hypothetical protein
MKRIAFLVTILFVQFTASAQDRKNEISITVGLSIPGGEHADKYATSGFCNTFVY